MNSQLENFPHVPRRESPPTISEKELQAAIIDTCRILGYRVAHFRPARVRRGGREIYETPVAADGKGWPDLCIVGHGRILFREIKVGKNTLSEEQARWLEDLRAAGIDAGVWHETDWLEKRVDAELLAYKDAA